MRVVDVKTRLLAKISISDTGCWVWNGCKSELGYGAIYHKGKRRSAHRVSYEIHRGPISPGLTLDHLCRNRACVNPDHLEPVSLRTNILRGDGPTARLARQTQCKRGHPYTKESTRIDKNGNRTCRICVHLLRPWNPRRKDYVT